MAKLPDFVIIGAMKCGTTALWRNCDQHPAITMGKNPNDPKRASTEIRFWNDGGPHHTWRKGIKWYKGLFNGRCCGEKCANYIESPIAMRRMHEHMPECKLVLCVRNPVERILSEFWMHHFKPEKIAKFPRFSRESGPRMRGQYMDQIRRSLWSAGWSPEQLYVVIQERMALNTALEMNKLFEWLGVEFHTPDVVDVTFEKRDQFVEGFRNWRTTHGCDMASETRVELERFYEPCNQRLFDITGERVAEWYQ